MKPKWKRYHYVYPLKIDVLTNYMRHSHPSASPSILPLPHPPSMEVMNNACELLLGTHDFGSYQSSNGRSTTVRTIHECIVKKDDQDQLVLSIASNGFLMHMVRIVAGTIMEVGVGLRTLNDIKKSISDIKRENAGTKLPGKHLYLDWVEYDQDHPKQPITHEKI
jgi:tRNA pseudouridine(38-40) synthase